MTEQQLDTLRFKLGGDWYDTWWLTIDERFDPMPLGFDEPTFFDLINKGWLEMYPPKKKTRKDFLEDLISSYRYSSL
jgi:hypothetical protein